MREDDMLRLSLDCARLAVRGEDFAPLLSAGADSIMRADAAAAFVTVQIDDRVVQPMPRVVVSGGPPPDDVYISDVVELTPRHPHTNRERGFDAPTSRLSDLVNLRRFWQTDVWHRLHGYVNGRYQAAANLGCYGGIAAFVVVQRANGDFSDDDLAVLDVIRDPLIPARAFHASWDAATARLRHPTDGRRPLSPHGKKRSSVWWRWAGPMRGSADICRSASGRSESTWKTSTESWVRRIEPPRSSVGPSHVVPPVE